MTSFPLFSFFYYILLILSLLSILFLFNFFHSKLFNASPSTRDPLFLVPVLPPPYLPATHLTSSPSPCTTTHAHCICSAAVTLQTWRPVRTTKRSIRVSFLLLETTLLAVSWRMIHRHLSAVQYPRL